MLHLEGRLQELPKKKIEGISITIKELLGLPQFAIIAGIIQEVTDITQKTNVRTPKN